MINFTVRGASAVLAAQEACDKQTPILMFGEEFRVVWLEWDGRKEACNVGLIQILPVRVPRSVVEK